MKANYLLIILTTLAFGRATAQSDSLMIHNFFEEEMTHGDAYQNLVKLCKKYPHRLSGSWGLEGAVVHCKYLVDSYDFDTTYLQEVTVPHWERDGAALVSIPRGNGLWVMEALALGGSVSTPDEGLDAEMEIIRSEEEWDQKGTAGLLKDKIVFVNIPMNPATVNAFEAYGDCWNVRGTSAIRAARYGAVGVVIRSLSQTINEFPHTGVMFYNDTVTKIPAAAISTFDAEELDKYYSANKGRIKMFQRCQTFSDKKSYNIIAEIRAKQPTNKYITIGGHLDCWDVGEGAHDDAAGIMHCLDALVLLKKFYKPNYNIRCVFFTNEENGNNGGKEYARLAKLNKENHVYALESDIGGFVPRGIGMDMTSTQIAHYRRLLNMLHPYYMDYMETSGGGVDIGPLKASGTILSYLIVDSQRYFDMHHSENDVVENVNERELKLGAAGIASWVYLLDQYGLGKPTHEKTQSN